MRRPLLLVLVLGLVIVGCDTVRNDDFVQSYVVESYQVANQPIASVRLTRTAPIGSGFDARQQAVRDADVVIHEIDESGRIARSFALLETTAGVYASVSRDVIAPQTRYRLEVRLPDGHQVRAETFVPGSFEIVDANATTLRYLGPEQLTLRLTPSVYPGRQSVYLLTNSSMDPRPENLTPPYRSLVDAGTITLDDVRVGASPILNEANYDRDATGRIVIRLPWLAVPFYGDSEVAINVIDTNIFDFLRTQSVQQGGSTLPPGEIPNVIDHVDGGTGVFGSMARETYVVTIVP
jgi:hypothetical protein